MAVLYTVYTNVIAAWLSQQDFPGDDNPSIS